MPAVMLEPVNAGAGCFESYIMRVTAMEKDMKGKSTYNSRTYNGKN
ncbi:MAG: hypothetical protein ACLT2Z_07260 [Eubacterium sp.]